MSENEPVTPARTGFLASLGRAISDNSYQLVNALPPSVESVFVWFVSVGVATGCMWLGLPAVPVALVTAVAGGAFNFVTSRFRKDHANFLWDKLMEDNTNAPANQPTPNN